VAMRLLFVVALLGLALGSVSGLTFIPKASIIEGAGKTPPVIFAATGCLMDYTPLYARVYTYEAATAMMDEIKKVIVEDKGHIALQGHGSAVTLDGCAGETAKDYATFLAPLAGLIKQVVSYGCRTGQQFVADLQALLEKDNKGVLVYGPEHPLVMDCGGAKKGNGRIFTGDAAVGTATPVWKKLSAEFQNALAKTPGELYIQQQAVYNTVKPEELVVGVRKLATTLAGIYTKLWRQFIDECDKQKLMVENGAGWVKAPKGFFFRQLYLNKLKAAHNRKSQNQLSPYPQ